MELIGAYKIHKIDYFYCSVVDQPGESYKLLSELEKSGINLLAFTAIPIGPNRTQLQLFPDNSQKLISEAKKSNLVFPQIFKEGMKKSNDNDLPFDIID
ncbi:MAG TPA: hypothetical protein PK073_03955 [Ignavibacteriaceae bacterium]|nr:hypothetical protein [Ignavibacteriaceae bacterium]